MNMPIYRARKIDSNEYIELKGFIDQQVAYPKENKTHIEYYGIEKIDVYESKAKLVQIEPTTIVMSFNGGITWRTINEVRNGLTFLGEPTLIRVNK